MVMDYPDGATPLNSDEMEGLKYPHIETRGELDQLEQQNIQEGYNWLKRQRKFKDFISEAFVIELHKQLFGSVWSWAGSFRNSDKNIGIDHLYIGVELRNLLEDARYWLEHGTYNNEEFAARFHHRLVKIHPFPNGNGRHARVLADTLLKSKLGEEPLDWARGVDLQSMNERRSEYIAALREADRGNYDPLYKFINLS